MSTRTIRRATLTALVFAALAGSAAAQTTPPSTPPAQDRPSQRMYMRQGMGSMIHMLGLAELRPGRSIQYSEGRLAFLKAELKITDAQTPAWDAFAAAMRENAAKLNEAYAVADRDAFAKMTPAERLAWQEKALGARFEALKRARAAFEPLYAALSDPQKQTLQRLVPTGGRFAGMRERMRDRMRQRMRERRERRDQRPGQPPRQ